MPPKTGAKGVELEEALGAYFSQAGYYVVRGVPYRLEGDDVTDVDLWLYERPAATNRRRMIVDIKNKRSPKASERLIWAKGLQAALGVDGAIVATTDKRESTRRLAKSLGVTLLDGDAVSRLTATDKLKRDDQVTAEDFDGLVKRVDSSRRSAEWRDELMEARSSLLLGFGVFSANRNLGAAGLFGAQALNAQPESWQAEAACRLAFLTASMAAISLDYMLSSQAFRPQEEVRNAITAAIRYGESGANSPMSTVRTAIGLIRTYADNGTAIAKQVEQRFISAAAEIQAELVADYVSRTSTTDSLFIVARELRDAAFAKQALGFDRLSAEARSFLGVVLDFNKVSRSRFAQAWSGKVSVRATLGVAPTRSIADSPMGLEDPPTGSLFAPVGNDTQSEPGERG